jgi:hypothetical protein
MGVSLKNTDQPGFVMGMRRVSCTVGTEFILLSLFEEILRWFTCTGLLLCASHAAFQTEIDQMSSLQRSKICPFKLCDSLLIQKIKAALPGPCSSHYLSLQTALTQCN